ncbi:MAG: hypothetical protein P1V21_09485 [Rhizobiaceae bacterium]|nr:hypothetical protein [Rhizobiaceae bacterium]
MSVSVENLVARIRSLQDQLEDEIDAKRDEFNYRIEKRRVVFEAEVARRHREIKTRLWSYVKGARLLVALTAPFIYALIFPFLLLDLFVTAYQAVCFPVYRIEKVRRADYIVFDRRHLAYLNGLQKLNCTYCSYVNGLIAFVREIASRTEQHWCPIKHARRVAGTHERYPRFIEFGDAEGFPERFEKVRQWNGTDKSEDAPHP